MNSLWVNVKNRKKYTRRPPVPTKFKGKNERYFLNEVVKYFTKRGWKAHHHDTNNPRNAWIIGPGFPDLVLAKRFKRKGKIIVKIIWAELKTERGYPNKDQIIWMDLLPKGSTFLWRPSDHKEWKAVARMK